MLCGPALSWPTIAPSRETDSVRAMRTRSGPFVAVLAAAAISALAIPGAAFASASNPSSVLTAAKSAIAKQTGVHLVVASSSSSNKDTVIGDLGVNIGEETITTGSATATIKVTSAYSYLSGNSAGLTSIIGLSAAQAKKLGQKWMSVKAGTSQYSTLKSGSTIAAVTAVLPPAKGTSVSTSSSNGTNLFILKWTTAATSSTPKLVNTVSISAKGAALPVEETASSTSGSGTTKFSNWGEHVTVAAPPTSSTISYTSVVG